MTGLCESGNEPPDSLKASKRIEEGEKISGERENAKDEDEEVDEEQEDEKGGRISSDHEIKIDNESIRIPQEVKYLGVILQPTGKSFTRHITERAALAIRGMNEIVHIHIRLLSLETEIKLFHAKIVSMPCYGIDIIWPNLNVANLAAMKKVKPRFLTETLEMATTTPSRLAFEMTRESFLFEELRANFLLPFLQKQKN
ncbi:hypothetical protein ANN_19083 [Periplaneta americana]|uniref:Uncharacterized protein n=1 Tax=Periplaneta americana TaxID=6978 RepID=A0ABQ8SQJ5_PERAM|nr:hypothetical protein ANN_19083 [Periplaneta americana]